MPKIFALPERISNRGFTMIEVVTVLILLGILTAVAIARVGDGRDAAERAAVDQLKAHLRFAQGLAMNSDLSWRVEGGGGSYSLFSISRDKDTNDVTESEHNFPGESGPKTLPAGVTFTVSFDTWGRPYNVADPEANNPITSDETISIGTKTITITPETGFIP